MNLESVIKVRGITCKVLSVCSPQMIRVEYKDQACLLTTIGSGSITVRNKMTGKFMSLNAELNERN